jgi:tripartite ATP-independent transporter DctM subunit
MVTAVLMLSFLIFLLIRMPVSIAMGLASLLALWWGDYPLMSLPHYMGTGVMNYTLMAVPFFIFAGNLMNEAGLTNRIFNFAMSVVGHIRGGLAQVNILASMIFAGISGSFVADTAGLGTVEMRAMSDRGYNLYSAAAITVSSSTIGPIIPPSIILIIYAIGARVSIARIFLAGVVPGIILGFLMMLGVYAMAARRPDQYPKENRPTLRGFWSAFHQSVLAVISPLIILWGMVGGVITPTEAGVLAVAWSVIVGLVYRELTLGKLVRVLYDSFLSSAHIMFLIAVGNLMGWIIAADGASNSIAAFLVDFADNQFVLLILINITALMIGCLMEPTPALLVCLPIFEPIVHQMGIDPLHFGILLCLNLTIGMLTPPVGLGLYVMCSVVDVRFEPLARRVLPFLGILILGLIIITYIPILSTWLPDILMPR